MFALMGESEYAAPAKDTTVKQQIIFDPGQVEVSLSTMCQLHNFFERLSIILDHHCPSTLYNSGSLQATKSQWRLGAQNVHD